MSKSSRRVSLLAVSPDTSSRAYGKQSQEAKFKEFSTKTMGDGALNSASRSSSGPSVSSTRAGAAVKLEPSLSGRTISHYRILDKLGNGGMGVIYRAQDVRLDRYVAVKFASRKLGSDPVVREYLRREAR